MRGPAQGGVVHHRRRGGGSLCPGDQVRVLRPARLPSPDQEVLPGGDLLRVGVPPADHPAGPGEGAVGVEDPLPGPGGGLRPAQQTLRGNVSH